jgi:peroxiredoxin Q/BCP
MLVEGKKAPAFVLESSQGGKVSLADLKGKIAVIYFYPRDNTPGCTTEGKDFQASLAAFKRLGAAVFGVSKDSIASHEKFAAKLGLKFPLLSDPDGAMIDKYGAWGEKNLYGKKSMGIIRSTVIVDAAGQVARVFPKVRVKGHVEAVLEAVKEIA